MDLTPYTEESATALRDALARAKEVIASEASQAALDDAAATVERAYAALVEKAANTADGSDDGRGCRSALCGLTVIPMAAALVLVRRRKED